MKVRPCDLNATQAELVDALTGIDVVVCSVGPADQRSQISLANAAKIAGVKRFVPCGFITVAPAGGIMWLRDEVRRSSFHSLLTQIANCLCCLSRKRLSTTISDNYGYLTRSSTSAGGTKSHTLASLPGKLTTP